MRALALAVVTALAVSGCTMPFTGDEAAGSFARTVVFTVDQTTLMDLGQAEPEEILQHIAATSYTYTHEAGEIRAADVSVRYADAEGREVTKPLSKLTSQERLARGDTVMIPDVHLTSGVALVTAEGTLAARDGVRADWLTAGGVPLPMALAAGDAATWDFAFNMQADASATRMSFDHFVMEDALLDVDADLSGTLGLSASGSAAQMDVGVDVALEGLLALLAEVTLTEEGQSFDTGMDLDADGTLDLDLDFTFADRALTSATAGGHIQADGTFIVWDPEHTKAERHEPEWVSHPFIDEELPRETIPIDAASEVLATTFSFLEDLWAMDLAPGDSFHMDMSIDMLLMKVESTYDVRVLSREQRTVSAGTFDTLRLSAVQETVVGLGGDRHRFPVAETTLWIDEDTYLPVAATASSDLKLDGRTFAEPLRMLSGGTTDLGDASFSLTMTSDLELGAHAGAPRVGGALFGAANALVLPVMMSATAFTPGAVGHEMGPMGEPAPPRVRLALNEGQDSVDVVSASQQAFWEEIMIRTTPGGYVALDRAPTAEDAPTEHGAHVAGPMMAGQSLSFCMPGAASDVRVALVHAPTNAVFYEATFNSVAAC